MVFQCLLLAILMNLSGRVHGQFLPTAPSVMENGSHVSALYLMGDSSVDCGKNSLFYPLLHRNLSLLPCNGKIGLPNCQPFYSQIGSIEGLIKGVNYGSAHATIISPSSQSHPSFNQQLRQVYETFQLLQLQLRQDRAQDFIKSSMFYLSFGRDDYVDLFLRNSSGMMLKYSGQEFARILANQMVHAIRTLYDANVRKIISAGILPLGCAPRVVWEWYNSTATHDGMGCVAEINELVLQYNTLLNEHIVELNEELPDAQIIFCDVYQGMMEVITPALFGTNPSSLIQRYKNACCGLGLHGAEIGCVSAETTCNQSSSHVWWDLYNPRKL
ncbi:GDSL esterase/lipase [Salix suchowensis]|nr:GDSL esterase/lipase [Salix suchowensis]